MTTLNTLRQINASECNSLSDYLAFYRKALPRRYPAGIEEEIGPVFLKKSAAQACQLRRRWFRFNGGDVDMHPCLDWHAAPHGDYEWTCTLARHHHLVVLADAYRRTGDESFAKDAIRQMRHWIDHVPQPGDPDKMAYLDVKRSHWRVLEVGYRIGETWLQPSSAL